MATFKQRVTLALTSVLFVFSIISLNWLVQPAGANDISRSYNWTNTIASDSGDYNEPVRVRADYDGNVYALGQFTGTVTFDGPGGHDTATNASPNAALYLTKYNANGDYQWTKTMTKTSLSQIAPAGLAVDSSNNVYLTASFTGTITFNDFAPGSMTASGGIFDSFVMKLNADGTHAWTKRTLSDFDSHAWATGLTVDYNGNVDVVGNFDSSVQFNEDDSTMTIASCGACIDGFVMQYAADGTFNWVTQLPGGGVNAVVQAYGVAVKNNSDIVLVGNYNSGTSPSGGIGPDTGGDTNAYIAYLSGSDGTYQTSAVYDEDSGQATNYGVKVGYDDSVFVTGAYAGTVAFDGPGGSDDYTSDGSGGNAYFTKINDDTSYGWTKTFNNTNGGSIGYDVAQDWHGNMYVFGTFEGDVEFSGGDTGSTNSDSAGFFSSFTYDGDYRYTQVISPDNTGDTNSGPGSMYIYGSNLYLAGSYNDTTTFDGPDGDDTRTPAGPDYDGFVSNWYLGPTPFTGTNEQVVAITSPAGGHNFSGNSMAVTGTSFPYAVITIKVDGATAGTATANSSGDWTFTATASTSGSHTVTAEYRPNAPVAYMKNGGDGKIHIVDILHHQALATIDHSSSGMYDVSLAVSPSGKIVYTTTGDDCSVGLIDQNTSASSIVTQDLDPDSACAYRGIAFSPDGNTAYVTYWNTDGIVSTGAVRSMPLTVGASVTSHDTGFECSDPYGISANTDNSELWVACNQRINVYNRSTLALKHTIDLTGDGGSAYHNFVFAAGKAYVADGNNYQIRIFDDDGSYNERTPFSHGTDSMYTNLAYAPASGMLYALVEFSNDPIGSHLTLLDTADDSWVTDIATQQPPESVAVYNGGTSPFVVGDDHSSGEVYFGTDDDQAITSAISFPGGSFYTLNSDFLLPDTNAVYSDSVSVTTGPAEQSGSTSGSGSHTTSKKASASSQTDEAISVDTTAVADGAVNDNAAESDTTTDTTSDALSNKNTHSLLSYWLIILALLAALLLLWAMFRRRKHEE